MKNKNLTFEKSFACFGHEGNDIVIDITSPEYVYATLDERAYLKGPAVDRLHEFEKFGMEPKELERVMALRFETIVQLRGTIVRLEAELEARKKNDHVDIHKLIDEIREKKDCSVHILIGDGYTSVDIRPDDPGLQRWEVASGFSNDFGAFPVLYRCPNCGFEAGSCGQYCMNCGEQLGRPVEEASSKKMNVSYKSYRNRPKNQDNKK